MKHSLLRKLTLPHPVRKLPASYYSFHKFPSLVLILSPTKQAHDIPSNISSQIVTLLQNSPPKLCMYVTSPLQFCMSSPCHSPAFHQTNNIWQGTQVTHSSLHNPSSVLLLALKFKYVSQHSTIMPNVNRLQLRPPK